MSNSYGLVKIGELAREAGVATSTIRYYCQRGLLTVAGYSKGGYRLFSKEESLKRIQQIRKVVESKITLEDLKGEIVVGV